MTSNVKLEPMAYVTMLKHLKKNQLDMKANLAPGEKHEEDSSPMLIYGFLLGFVEEDVCTITEYVPIMSVDKEIDFEVLHKMFHIADRVNEDRYDPEYISEQIVGWVHSSEKDSVQYNQLDIKNHIYIQTAYNANAVLLLLPCSGDQYSMEFRSFRDKIYEIDETSPFSEIDWNFKDVDDIDEVFQTVVDIYRWKYRKSPILKEFTEILEENEEDE
jgi:proteasome lid subunit RPN8/RPN11